MGGLEETLGGGSLSCWIIIINNNSWEKAEGEDGRKENAR